jgi:hypothetical protein
MSAYRPMMVVKETVPGPWTRESVPGASPFDKGVNYAMVKRGKAFVERVREFDPDGTLRREFLQVVNRPERRGAVMVVDSPEDDVWDAPLPDLDDGKDEPEELDLEEGTEGTERTEGTDGNDVKPPVLRRWEDVRSFVESRGLRVGVICAHLKVPTSALSPSTFVKMSGEQVVRVLRRVENAVHELRGGKVPWPAESMKESFENCGHGRELREFMRLHSVSVNDAAEICGIHATVFSPTKLKGRSKKEVDGMLARIRGKVLGTEGTKVTERTEMTHEPEPEPETEHEAEPVHGTDQSDVTDLTDQSDGLEEGTEGKPLSRLQADFCDRILSAAKGAFYDPGPTPELETPDCQDPELPAEDELRVALRCLAVAAADVVFLLWKGGAKS